MRRQLIIAAILTAAYAGAREYRDFPQLPILRPNARILAWDPISGYGIISGARVTPPNLSGYVQSSYTSIRRVTAPRLTAFSSSTWSAIRAIPAGPQGPRGYDGYDGDTYTCAVTGSPVSVLYDHDGISPAPGHGTYSSHLWRNGVLVTSVSPRWEPRGWIWTAVSSAGRFLSATMAGSMGSGSTALLAQYSSATYRCVATLPVTATRVGPKGDQGDPAQVSRDLITTKLAEQSDTPVSLQPLSTDVSTPMLEIRDQAGNVRNWIAASGYQRFRDANGYVLAQIQTDGTLKLLDPSVVERVVLRNDGTLSLQSATTTAVTVLRGNGSTPAFRIYSSGRYHGDEGVPAVTGYCLAGRTDGTRYWTTCGSGGGGTPGGSNLSVQYNANGVFSGFGRYSAVAQALIIKQLVIQ